MMTIKHCYFRIVYQLTSETICYSLQQNNMALVAVFLMLVVSQGGFPAVSSQFDGASCGGELFDSRGTIFSPKFNDGYYPDSTTCNWRIISGDKRKKIKISFAAFEIEEEPECDFDYLEIFDGSSSKSPRIGKFCGDEKPKELTSSSESLYLKFRSDGSVSKKGFKLSYEITADCDKKLEGVKGIILSPLYPATYPSDVVCSYEITVPEGKRVELKFIDLDIEDDPKCQYDYVEIFEGHRAKNSTLGRFCGSMLASVPVYAKSNRIVVVFSSDESVKGRGFKAVYKATLPHWCKKDNGGCSQICTDLEDGRICSCRSGYQLGSDGQTCEDINECLKDNGGCNGRCVNTFGSYKCECSVGFQNNEKDEICRDIDECVTKNGGCDHVCHNTYGSFYCTCRDGYTKNGSRCKDIDECSSPSTNFCSQGCNNTPGDYLCFCRKGYKLTANKRTCIDIDECASYGLKCEQNCVNFPGSYRCECLAGYKKHPSFPFRCMDVDECLAPPLDCHNCINTAGGFFCECNQGYEPDNSRSACVDVNECAFSNGGCNNPHQQCVNIPGSHYCSCSPGFNSSDKLNSTCLDINECEGNNGRGPCDHSCRNLNGSFVCSCETGYRLGSDGRSCIDINECISNPCAQRCINAPGNYSCGCFIGYEKKEKDPINGTCIDIDECKTGAHRCESGCVNTIGSHTCTCPPGFLLVNGTKCIDVDECAIPEVSAVCQQKCVNTKGSWNCSCQPGYVLDHNGRNCTDINECLPSLNPCVDAIDCINSLGSFQCVCRKGHKLSSDNVTCSGINECLMNNGGCEQICRDLDTSFECACNAGYLLQKDGSNCADINECRENSSCCNQLCANKPGSYECSCQPGYRLNADNCTCEDIDECKIGNGGCQQKCINSLGSFRCECQRGYAQNLSNPEYCDDIDECQTNNGGCDHYCTNIPGSFNCTCKQNFDINTDGKSCDVCPTCQDFRALKKLVENLQRQVENLQQLQLSKDSVVVSQLSSTCTRKGSGFDKVYKSGSKWSEAGCRACYCENGVIECKTAEICGKIHF